MPNATPDGGDKVGNRWGLVSIWAAQLRSLRRPAGISPRRREPTLMMPAILIQPLMPGRAIVMRTYSWLAFFLFICSCGTPEPRPTSPFPESWGPPPPPVPQAKPVASPNRQPMKASITTMGDIVDKFGLHIDYLSLANATCWQRQIECKKDTAGLDIASCQIVVAQEWCKVNDCSRGFNTTEPPDPCKRDVWSRQCDDLDRPIQCGDVQAAGLTLVPSAWPEGPVVDPMPPMN